MRSVVERAFATSSNATRVHPHRAAAVAHRDRDLLAERCGRLGQHHDVGALLEGEVGDRRRVGHLAEGVPAQHGDGCRVAGDRRAAGAARRRGPRRCRPRTARARRPSRCRTTRGAGDGEERERDGGHERRTPPPAPRSATTCAATHWFCSPKPCGHSSTAATRAVPSTTAQPRMRGSIPSTLGEGRASRSGRGRPIGWESPVRMPRRMPRLA